MRVLLAMAVAMASAGVSASGADGVWKTESNKEGAYIEVTIAPCAADAGMSCGTITRAVTAAGEDPHYVNLGKPIIEGMKPDGANAYSGGTVWDPESNKTYKSKMTMQGEVLDVEGCISFICQGEHWQRIK